ncbi:MAG: D-tyrosyl-tRNA(Tyr) deacylase [Chloroflexi bacterium]|nr:D-tyrosyl-tRNA(Tyr) deacylase [Chloroflexota bacterium]
MRAVLQRVARGEVSVDGEVLGKIGPGLVLLVGVREGDGEEEAAWLAQKAANLRIFADDEGRFDRSLLDVGGAALVISQFTLYGDARRGRRPSFTDAALPAVAEPLVERFVALLRAEGLADVQTGRFGAHMVVSLANDGPVTIILDTDVSRSGQPKR